MKTYVIYTPSNFRSLTLAKECASSFRKFRGWDASLSKGCDPTRLHLFQESFPLSDERSKWSIKDPKYASKKSCFYSHYRLWHKCVELNKPICIAEYDVMCVADYPSDLSFDGVIHFAIESILRLGIYSKLWPQDHQNVLEKGDGIHPMQCSQLVNGYPCIPGNVAYGITPDAAATLIENCIKYGWQQNDLLMTTELIPINYIMPCPVVYDPTRDLHTSSMNTRI